MSIKHELFYWVLNPRTTIPAATQRPKDVPLRSEFGRDVLDHNRTKIGHIKFLTYFGSAISDIHLESGNVEKFSEKPILSIMNKVTSWGRS